MLVERQSKAKLLQMIAGTSGFVYWLSTFLWDILNYQIAFISTGAFDAHDLNPAKFERIVVKLYSNLFEPLSDLSSLNDGCI